MRERALFGRASVSDDFGPLARTRRSLLHAGLARESRHWLDRRVFDHAFGGEYVAWRGVWDPRGRRSGCGGVRLERPRRRVNCAAWICLDRQAVDLVRGFRKAADEVLL